MVNDYLFGEKWPIIVIDNVQNWRWTSQISNSVLGTSQVDLEV